MRRPAVLGLAVVVAALAVALLVPREPERRASGTASSKTSSRVEATSAVASAAAIAPEPAVASDRIAAPGSARATGAPLGSASSAGTPRLRGRVVAGGRPVPGAVVTLRQWAKRPGDRVLEGLAEDEVELLVRVKEGWALSEVATARTGHDGTFVLAARSVGDVDLLVVSARAEVVTAIGVAHYRQGLARLERDPDGTYVLEDLELSMLGRLTVRVFAGSRPVPGLCLTVRSTASPDDADAHPDRLFRSLEPKIAPRSTSRS